MKQSRKQKRKLIKKQEKAKVIKMDKRKVVIEVSGGVAEVTKCPKDVEVEIIDHDNKEAEEN